MEKYGIVILGNGFDLFHGHKTSYKDFIYSVKDRYSNNLWISYFDSLIQIEGWVDIENEFLKILNSYTQFKFENITYNINTPINMIYKDLFLCLGYTINIYSELYKEEYMSSGQRKLRSKLRSHYDKFKLDKTKFDFIDENSCLNYKLIHDTLIRDFIQLKSLLKSYIKGEVLVNDNYSKENSISRLLSTYSHLIVFNFNYTDTLSFYNSNITNIFVHGSVDDEIIFGHNNIELMEYSIFNKHVQTQISDMNYKHKFVNTLLEKNFKPGQLLDLIVLGHSFDANDHGVISWMYTTLFNNRNYFARFKYFYYPTESNTDLINRNFNIKSFYEKNIGTFTNETLDFLNSIRYQHGSIPMQVNIKHGAERIYNGSDELDYFQRTGTFEKIELM